MSAATPFSSPRLGIRHALELSPGAVYAIRFGVAVCTAIWIGKAPGLVENSSHWIAITVVVLMQQTTGAALLKGLLRAAGTLAGALTAIVPFGLFAQDPPLLAVAIFAVQAIAAYGYLGRQFQYAWFVWAFTTAVVLGGAIGGQDAVETVAFQRASMVGIGVLLVFLVDSMLWPARAERLLRRQLAARARRLGDRLRRAIAPRSEAGEPGVEAMAPEPGGLASQLALLDSVRAERVSSSTADALARVAILLETLDSRARLLAARGDALEWGDPEARAFEAAQARLARRVQSTLDELAVAVTASRATTTTSEALEEELLALEAERDRLFERAERTVAAEGRAADLADLVAVVGTLQTTLTPTRPPRGRGGSGSLLSFRPDPFRTKVALRTGIAIVAAFLVPAALGWPLNALVAPIAFLVVATPTRGAAAQTLIAFAATLALAWLVADLLSVYVGPHAGRAPLALAPAFAVAATFAYLGTRRPQLALLPIIGGLVGLLPVYGGAQPPTNVYGPYNLVCYMALALGIGWLFSRMLWPATASHLFRHRVAVLLDMCRASLRRADEAPGVGARRPHEDPTRGWAEQSAPLAKFHVQAGLEPVERALDQDRRARLLALVEDLRDAVLGYRAGTLERVLAEGGPSLLPLLEALRRAERALVESMEMAADALRGAAESPLSDLAGAREAIEAHLTTLRAHPELQPRLPEEERRRILVEVDARSRLIYRQQAIEAWLAEWRNAEQNAAPGDAAPGLAAAQTAEGDFR